MAKVLSFCFLAAGLCFAQNPFDVQLQAPPQEGSAPVEEAPAVPVVEPPPPPPPTPEQKAPAPSGKAAFDVLRGHAYNPFSIVGAANNVLDLVSTPSDINGQKFVYVSPDRLGYAAFDLGGGSMLLGFDNSSNLGALILGYATSGFGVALNYSVGKVWTSSEEYDIDVSRRTTYPGDNIGLYFSLPNGIYASAGWLTYDSSYAASVDKDDYKRDISVITASAGKLGGSGSLSYDAYLNFIRYGGSETNDDGDKAVTSDTYFGVLLNFDFGYTALQKEKAKVIIGFNNMVGMAFLDKVKGYKSDNVILARIRPNILGEVILAERWLAFVGAMQDLYLLAGDADREKNTSWLEITQTPTQTLFAGMRYQRANIALEAQVSNNPFAALNGNNILAQLGGFIYF